MYVCLHLCACTCMCVRVCLHVHTDALGVQKKAPPELGLQAIVQVLGPKLKFSAKVVWALNF